MVLGWGWPLLALATPLGGPLTEAVSLESFYPPSRVKDRAVQPLDTLIIPSSNSFTERIPRPHGFRRSRMPGPWPAPCRPARFPQAGFPWHGPVGFSEPEEVWIPIGYVIPGEKIDPRTIQALEYKEFDSRECFLQAGHGVLGLILGFVGGLATQRLFPVKDPDHESLDSLEGSLFCRKPFGGDDSA